MEPFVKRKKDPQGNIFGVFFVDTLETTFRMEHFTQRWTQAELFFKN